MQKYMVSRLLQTFFLLFFVSLVMFSLISAAPGGPSVLLQQEVSDELAERMREQLGLNQPVYRQYFNWLGGMIQGDMGRSYSYARPVTELIEQRIGPTLILGAAALFIAIIIGVPLGIISAIKRYSAIDYFATGIAFFGLSIPVFWFGIMLIIVFSVTLNWLPSGGLYKPGEPITPASLLRHLILPAIVLGTPAMAQLARYTRSSMITVMSADYIRTARSKGINDTIVLWKHGFKNGLIPILSILGVIIPRLFSGAAITESVFSWPGLGRLAVESAFQRDYPVIMALTVFVSALVIITNFIVDLLYAAVDPRIKY